MERDSGGEYRLARRADAYRFCVEVPCTDLEQGLAPAPGAALQTLPHVPMALHASWYYFWGNARRFADLLALLDMSVCGPAALSIGGGSGAAAAGGAAAVA